MKIKAFSTDLIHWYPKIWSDYAQQYVEIKSPGFISPEAAIIYAKKWNE